MARAMIGGMWPLPEPWHAAAVGFDALMAPHGSAALLVQRRERRLAALMAAAQGSAFYRARFARHGAGFGAQSPVTKEALMAHFHEWVTDPRLALPALRRFLADPSRIGSEFAGGYTVWESSGSTGVSGVFVQDARAMSVYDALEALRRPASAVWRLCADPFLTAQRVAFVGATGGHFTSTVSLERLRRRSPALARGLRGFSLLQPRAALLKALEAWQPTVLATYPSAALMLAEEAEAGRLRLSLTEILTGGEHLSEPVRRAVARSLGCPVHGSYGASEFLALASECDQQRLHLNSDWVILESVDEAGHPVPPGEAGHTALLTNLANHVQPLIRYDLGDRVRFDPRSCGCGSRLPVIEVQGRVDDALCLIDAHGHAVRLPPLAITTVLEDEAGVFDFQLVQEGPRRLSLTLGEVSPMAAGASADRGEAPTARARQALAAYLRGQGLAGVRLEIRQGEARVRGRTGKQPRVVEGGGWRSEAAGAPEDAAPGRGLHPDGRAWARTPRCRRERAAA